MAGPNAQNINLRFSIGPKGIGAAIKILYVDFYRTKENRMAAEIAARRVTLIQIEIDQIRPFEYKMALWPSN